MIQLVDRIRPGHFPLPLRVFPPLYLSISALPQEAEQPPCSSAAQTQNRDPAFKRRGSHVKCSEQHAVPALKPTTEPLGAPLHEDKPRLRSSVLLEWGTLARSALSVPANLLVLLVTGLFRFPAIIRGFAIVDDELDSGW